MKVSFEEVIDTPFVLKSDTMKQIWDLLQEKLGKVNMSIKCCDKSTRKFFTWDEIIGYKNQTGKEITGMWIRAWNYSTEMDRGTNIYFNSDLPERAIVIDIEGSDEFVDTLKEEIYNSIEDVKVEHPAIIKNRL